MRSVPSCFDCIAHTAKVQVTDARYRYEVMGIQRAPAPISDPAALTITAELTDDGPAEPLS